MGRTVKAAVIGGGTGAPVSIRTLLDMNVKVSSIVSMVDDGGSSGILRERGGVIPPGDIRKCIMAMSADPDCAFARAFRHRFSYLDDHSLGNLIITAFAEETGSFADAISICEHMLDARGHVYPSTLHDIKIAGTTVTGEDVAGEIAVGDSPAAMREVHLIPSDPAPHPTALNKIREADLIVLGPGSLFTSIIPSLLVPGVVDSIAKARNREVRPATTLFVCNLADMQGETWGMNSYDCVAALLNHGMEGLLDIALIHQSPEDSPYAGTFAVETDYRDSRFQSRGRREGQIRHMVVNQDLLDRIKSRGVKPMVRDLVDRARPTWHDTDALAAAFEEVLEECRLRVR